MNNLKVHFSSKKHDWTTPQDLFDKLDAIYNFEWDAAASADNTKVVGCYFDEQDDALTQDWSKTATCFWLNPLYGRTIGKWVQKAYEESLKGCTVVCLLPARTDTRYFHEYCTKGTIEFIKGRLKFGGSKNSAPFPSMIVVFSLKEV